MTHNLGYLVMYVIVIIKMTIASEAVRIEDGRSKYEEYIVEHEVSATEAKNLALTMHINQMAPPAGCQTCTNSEISYCLSSSLINDHCCCDKRYKEHLPFIPHTCFMGVTLCKPALDCDEYTRLRRCCCNKLLLQLWKQKSTASLPSVSFLLIILYIVNMYL